MLNKRASNPDEMCPCCPTEPFGLYLCGETTGVYPHSHAQVNWMRVRVPASSVAALWSVVVQLAVEKKSMARFLSTRISEMCKSTIPTLLVSWQ